MIVVRGINVFPTMIAEVVHQISELSGEYRIRLGHLPPYDFLPIEVEVSKSISNYQGLVAKLENRIKQNIGVSAKVSLLAPDSLPRTESKTKRVIRDY